MTSPESVTTDPFHDELTGLLNRAGLDHILHDLEAVMAGKFSLLVADLDGLKRVNDRLGHAAGNRLLICAGRIMAESVRTEPNDVEHDHRTEQKRAPDTVAVRIHGDEFAIVLPGVSDTETLEIIRKRVEQNLLAVNIGVSIDGRPHKIGEPVASLLEDADLIMLGRKDARRLDRFNALPLRKKVAARIGDGLLRYAGINPPRQ